MRKLIISVVTGCLACSSVAAQDSGFLTDYSKLSPGGDSGFTRVHIAPGAIDRVGRFDHVMIDQPSLVLSPDSKYKGVKPSDIASVAESLRASMIEGVETRITVSEEPGEDVGLVSWAVSNIRVNKAKRGVLSYTPVGAVAYGAKTLASDVIDKTRAFDVVLEGEVTDSVTGEVLFAMVLDVTEAGEEAQWGDALALTNRFGQRLGCRIKNARLPVEEREDCLAIPILDLAED
jgi:hypothetical protein